MKPLPEPAPEQRADGDPSARMRRVFVVLHLVLAMVAIAIFAVNVRRYQFLGDDCYIAFRYAANLVDGHGLVFNPGERVEGYTQPLWVLLMALGIKLGTPPQHFSALLGIASGIAILLLLPWFTLRLHSNARSVGLWIWIAPLALAVNRSFCAWSTGGLGTQMFALLVLLSLMCFSLEWKSGTQRPIASSLLFALTTFARPEGGLFAMVCGLFLLYDVLARRRRPFSTLLVWGLPYAAIVAGHLAWRYDYYGHLLPTTFHAKVSGFWWDQSKLYLSLFAKDHLLILSLPLLLFFFSKPEPREQWRPAFMAQRLFLAQVAAYTAYIIYIGGDRFEYRFMTPILPLLYWLLQETVRRGHAFLQQRKSMHRFDVELSMALSVMVIGSSALPLWTGFPVERVDETGINRIEKIGFYSRQRRREGLFLRKLVNKGYLTGNELIAVRGAGALPYYSGFPILDLHGLNDEQIAHSEIAERGVIAHEKEATLDYVRERGAVICNVRNRIVFDSLAEGITLMDPNTEHYPWFPGPVRCVEALGNVLIFGTTLSNEEFRETFARFKVIR